ncbi:TRAP transporter substrate-binding protein [Bordetella sp. N]|uniref:TRAP transporter substrate-binding protein n=1 Tax=Bordetella sp. N TaxID=1746199 RepID=UPI0007094F1F|nr:TRAP transporter substrate-binding protein [Bordetella sp. N]ALM82267.1 ABC transporter substrate-binding protein [Bordetella sp. N]
MSSSPGRIFLKRSGVAAAAALAGPLVLPRYAHAAEFSLKYAHNAAVSHPQHVWAIRAADAIKEQTAGQVEINVFPNNQLGSDTDTLSQLRAGAVDFFTMSGLILSSLVPVAAINGISFAFRDYEQAFQAMDGALGTHVREAIRGKGLVVFDKIWNGGVREITSGKKPIHGPDDLKGFKIRVPPSALWVSTFESLGAVPASINWNETYSALQTNLVDGQESPLVSIDTSKLYEVQKYCSLSHHMWDGFWLLGNRRGFARLPARAQEIITAEFNRAAIGERQDIITANAALQQQLAGRGLEFIDVDQAAFRARLQQAGFYARWKEKFGQQAWGLLEASVGQLA